MAMGTATGMEMETGTGTEMATGSEQDANWSLAA